MPLSDRLANVSCLPLPTTACCVLQPKLKRHVAAPKYVISPIATPLLISRRWRLPGWVPCFCSAAVNQFIGVLRLAEAFDW